MAVSTSSRRNVRTRSGPCQRAISGGISLPTRQARTAAWPRQAFTPSAMVRWILCAKWGESRNATCSAQGIPAMTRRPCSPARSSSQRGGTVKVRKVLAPSSRISVKSRSISDRSGNGAPCEAGAKGPYVTPLRKNFSPSTKKNFPLVTTGASSVTRDTRGDRTASASCTGIMSSICERIG